MRKLFVLTLALLGALLLAAPAQAQRFRGTGHGGGYGGFRGNGFGYGAGFNSFGYGYGSNFRYDFFPFVPQTYYVQPAYVQPVYVPAPVAPAYVAPAALPAAAPAVDPCAAAAGSYGVAPAELAGGYSPFYGNLNVYGGVPLYFNGLGYHVYDVRTGRFIHARSDLVRGAARVGGLGHEHFARAGHRGPAPAPAGRPAPARHH